MELIRRKGGRNYKPRARKGKRRFDFRHKQSLSIQTLAKKNTETAGRRPGYKEASTKKQCFSSENKKNAISEQETALCFASVSRMD
jgi:hypothetical protein